MAKGGYITSLGEECNIFSVVLLLILCKIQELKNHVGLEFQEAKARQCVAMLDSLCRDPERTLCEATKVRLRIQWRFQGAGDARNMNH